MPVQKLETVDAFVLTDFADVPASGYVRRARKILQASAWDMARSATYSFASFGLQHSGASAGVNATDDDATAAVTAFHSELAADYAAGSLSLADGKGMPAAEGSPQSPDHALVAGVVSAARWALGSSLDNRRVAVEGPASSPTVQAVTAAMTEHGASVVEVDGVSDKPWLIWGADVDLMVVGSRPGAMNHQGAELVTASAVVPWSPVPVTTKALAVLLKRDVTYIPDFISSCGPLLTGIGPRPDLADEITDVLDAARSDQPLFLACCGRAEDYLRSWRDALPFGRPLAG